MLKHDIPHIFPDQYVLVKMVRRGETGVPLCTSNDEYALYKYRRENGMADTASIVVGEDLRNPIGGFL
jgi:hypothetical protein